MPRGKKRTASQRGASKDTVAARKSRAGRGQSGLNSHQTPTPPDIDNARTEISEQQAANGNTVVDNSPPNAEIPVGQHPPSDQPSSSTPLTSRDIPAIVRAVMDNMSSGTDNQSSPPILGNSSGAESAPALPTG